VKKNRVSSAGGGGYCCDHCSDSKFPCVFMERQMKKEPRRGQTRVEKASEGPVSKGG